MFSALPLSFIKESEARFEQQQMEIEDQWGHEFRKEYETPPCFYNEGEVQLVKTKQKREVPPDISFF